MNNEKNRNSQSVGSFGTDQWHRIFIDWPFLFHFIDQRRFSIIRWYLPKTESGLISNRLLGTSSLSFCIGYGTFHGHSTDINVLTGHGNQFCPLRDFSGWNFQPWKLNLEVQKLSAADSGDLKWFSKILFYFI